MFQSAPPTRVRGDQCRIGDHRAKYVFQSAPPTRVRGDISIETFGPTSSQFQSAPPTRVRGDIAVYRYPRHYLCFNPLPQPELGEIFAACFAATTIQEFQSAPPTRVRGDLPGSLVHSRVIRFQSAPPTRVRGDAIALRSLASSALFQSAPPTRVRGDKRCSHLPKDFSSFNPLPQPELGEIFERGLLRCGRCVSIRSPNQS